MICPICEFTFQNNLNYCEIIHFKWGNELTLQKEKLKRCLSNYFFFR